jgi:hypothetical protein
MSSLKDFNHTTAAIGWGMLFIWWGIVIIVKPLTIGMGAIGSGLIMLGVNAARLRKGIPDKGSTATMGSICLAWGILDQARLMLGLNEGVSWAALLIVIGVVVFLVPLLARPKAGASS